MVRYLKPHEIRRLVDACTGQFRALVQATLLTGCRYSELTRLRVSAFNPDSGTLAIRPGLAQQRVQAKLDAALGDDGNGAHDDAYHGVDGVVAHIQPARQQQAGDCANPLREHHIDEEVEQLHGARAPDGRKRLIRAIATAMPLGLCAFDA